MADFIFNAGPFVLVSAEFRSPTVLALSFNYTPDPGLAGYVLTVDGLPVTIASQAQGLSVYEVLLTVPYQPAAHPAVISVNTSLTSAAVPIVPSSLSILTYGNAPPVGAKESLVQGASNDEMIDTLRRFLPPLYRNKPGWEALLGAFATGDSEVQDNAMKAFNQLFLSSASGNYLIERAADQGVGYPDAASITEDSFRKLAILLANSRQVQQALLGILQIFYGYDSTHARLATTSGGSWSLRAGDTLSFRVDVAAVISRAFRDAQSAAFATPAIIDGADQVVVYSGVTGLLGSLAVTGGMVNRILVFPTQKPFDNGVTTQSWTAFLVSPDEFKFVWQGTGAPGNLLDMKVGDYVTLDMAAATEFRGSYRVIDLKVENEPVSGSFADMSWFSIMPTPGFPYTVVNTPNSTFATTNGEIIFFDPKRQTVIQNQTPSYLAQHDPVSGVDVILPVITQAVGKAFDAAAYPHEDYTFVDDVGPYIYDQDGLAVTGVETTSTTTVAQGRGIGTLPVASTVGFPNSECYVALGFATQYEVGPVRCLGVLDSNNLSIDRAFVFPKTIPSGSAVTLLAQKTGFDLSSGAKGFVLTDSSAGRIAAESFIDESKAAGVNLNKTLIYPGDRGLGGQGDPVTGIYLSDNVSIWASDDVDAAVEAAHNA
jgi:hypothetical protein